MEESKTDKCPYCNQPITHQELEQIQIRIKADLAAEMQKFESEAKARIEADEKRIAEERKNLEGERARSEHLRKQLEEEKLSYQSKLKQEADNRLQTELKKVHEEHDKVLALQKQLDDDKAAYRQQLEKENQERLAQERDRIQKELEEKQKELLEEGKKAGRLEGDGERRNLQKKIEDLSRQLEKKTADELGSLPEEELAKRLAEAFREDKISRIPKGEQGADVRHEVVHKGVPCGLIIYESKNRKDWQNAYIDRAKQYKVMYKTSSVILVSISFPAGEQNFCIREGIVIVHPSIVVPIVEIIRATILKLHLTNLSMQERETKMKEVYEYIAGEHFKVQIDGIVTNIADLQKVQQKEKEEHDRVWSKQTALFEALQRSAFTIKSKIDNIIQRTD